MNEQSQRDLRDLAIIIFDQIMRARIAKDRARLMEIRRILEEPMGNINCFLDVIEGGNA